METRVFKVSFKAKVEELNEQYEELTDYEKEDLMELSAETYFEYTKNNEYFLYIVIEPENFNEYIEILDTNDVEYEMEDISDDVLSGKIDITEELKKVVNSDNIINWKFFSEDIEDWIYYNLDMDMVLDRISQVGMDNLRDIEIEFLENYNNPPSEDEEYDDDDDDEGDYDDYEDEDEDI
jgi:hypothetical protein